MNIVFIGGRNVPQLGGIESYLINLSSQLKKMGHNVWIICRGPKQDEKIIDGVLISQIKCPSFDPIAYPIMYVWASLMVITSKKKWDVINYQSFFLTFLYIWIPLLFNIKVCTTIHSFAIDNPCNRFKYLLLRFEMQMSRIFLRNVISVSQTKAQQLKERMNIDSYIIHCGVNMPEYVNNIVYLDNHNIQKGNYLLTIGRLVPVKNVDILIDAFQKSKAHDDVQLVIGGDYNTENGKTLLSKAKNDSQIIFVGPVFDESKSELFQNCLAYTLVSSSEGFPIAILEAMSYGKVCIASDILANKEALTDQLGVWCGVRDVDSLANAIDTVVEHKLEYEEIKNALAKRIGDYFTWDKVALKYIDYLNTVVGIESKS